MSFGNVLYNICWWRHWVDVYNDARYCKKGQLFVGQISPLEKEIKQHFKQWTNVHFAKMDLQELPYQQQSVNLLRNVGFFLHIDKTIAVPGHDCLTSTSKYTHHNKFNMFI